MPVFYGLIARGSLVVCDHSLSGSHLEGLATSILEQISPSDSRRIFSSGNYKLYALVSQGLTYVCITDSQYEAETAFDLLSAVQRALVDARLQQKALKAKPYELRGEFGQRLGHELSMYCGDNTAALQGKVAKVEHIMRQNVEKLTVRGDLVSDLQGRAEELALNSVEFNRTASKLRRKIMWKSVKLWVVVIIIILVIATVITVLIVLAATKKI